MTSKAEPTPSAGRVVWNGYSHQGPRAENQDAFILAKPDDPRLADHGVLLVVCDGVGGEKGGKIASAAASQTAYASFYDAGKPGEVSESLVKAVADAHAAVKIEAAKDPALGNMASTIVMAHVQEPGGRLTVAHVGDSRAYRFRDHKLTRLTNDHNWVFEQVQRGLMTEEDAKVSTMRNMITRSLGSSPNNTAEVHHVEGDMQPGDRLLLCTDGLHGIISQTLMEDILGRNTPARSAAEALVQAALPTTTDNTTAVVLDYAIDPGIRAVAGSVVRPAAGLTAVAAKPRNNAPVAIVAGLAGLVAVGGLVALLLSSRGPTPVEPIATVTVDSVQATELVPTEAVTTNKPRPTATGIVVVAASPQAEATAAVQSTLPTATIFVPTFTPTPVPPTLTPVPTFTPVPTITPPPAPTNTPVPAPTSAPPPQNGGGGGGGGGCIKGTPGCK